jgi:hypothetical protein
MGSQLNAEEGHTVGPIAPLLFVLAAELLQIIITKLGLMDK